MTESEVKQNEQEEVKNDIEVLCPSCGRFVGAYEICPHCQTQVNTRVSIKLVKRIAVIGAIVGIILLYFAAKNREVPMINIGEIQINHNMALVKVSGRVIRESIQDKKDNFSLTIDDGTGKIKLGGYNKLKKWKKHFGEKFPKEGDFIEVTGNLNITEQFGASMFLSSPHRLVVKKSFNCP
ncbi:OB-fold nucleic acid binding domain-containing protein [bacterium]|nr:OB-fold nucleic acid binding domain-containing protein [bacterium]